MRSLLPGLVFLLASGTATAFDYIRYQAPARFAPPIVTRSALGATYDYRPRDRSAGHTLQITVAKIPPALSGAPEASPEGCLSMFAQALKRRAPDLFMMASTSRLMAGPLELAQWRWTHHTGTDLDTGVLACALYKQHFITINFSAPSNGSPKALQDLRSSLAALELNF